ncbi:MAG: squalene synthase HpnC [Ignavibacteriales bacterium]|nr:MAG: squalene synthase HpnC [Ignavibacteriales bacterium]
MVLSTTKEFSIEAAYDSALKFAGDHYENFPVISFFVPKKLRKHVAIIYWFARTADDISDEGILSDEERISGLDKFKEEFSKSLSGDFETEYHAALANTVDTMKLNPDNFYNLISAFRQDVTKKRYNSFDEILDYCRRSANPVGRLILELYNIRNEEAFLYSDKICAALQLANFYQDISIDRQKGRLYLSLDELSEYSVNENMFEFKENSLNLKQLLKHNVDRTENMLYEGKELLKFLKGRLKYEISWTILGGLETLNKIKKIDYNVLNIRPVLSKADFLKLLIKSFYF